MKLNRFDLKLIRFLKEEKCLYLKTIFFFNLLQIEPNKSNNEFIRYLACNVINLNEILTNLQNGIICFLPFHGYSTDGGFFDNEFEYHYNNLFTLDSKFYCSAENTSNFNVYSAFISNLYSDFNISINELPKHYKDFQKVKDLLKFDKNIGHKKIEKESINRFCLNARKSLIFKPNKFSQSSTNFLDDSKLLENFLLKDYFALNFIYFNNNGFYTCPGKTVLIFIHDTKELTENDNKMLLEMKTANTLESLYNYVKSKDYLKKINMKSEEKIVHCEFDTLLQREKGMNLKLVFWLQIKQKNNYFVELKQFIHFGKFVLINFIDAIKTSDDSNIDFSKVFFFGNVLKMKSND